MSKKLMFSGIALLAVGLVGGLLVSFMLSQQEPERQLFAQVDFDVEDKYIMVDRMEWPNDRMELKYVEVSKEQQHELLELFEQATFTKVDGQPEKFDYSLTLGWNTRHRLYIDVDGEKVIDPESGVAYEITAGGEAIRNALNAL